MKIFNELGEACSKIISVITRTASTLDNTAEYFENISIDVLAEQEHERELKAISTTKALAAAKATS